MKISFIKYKEDKDTYKIAKGLGMDVFEIDTPEMLDGKIEELKNTYNTIFIPTNLASFSEKISSKYQYSQRLKIILTPSKKCDV